MTKSNHYRLIFHGLKNDTLTDNLLAYLKKDLALTERAIKDLVLSPPRVLATMDEKDKAFKEFRCLDEIGGYSTLETCEIFSSIPYSLNSRNCRRIRKEMKKAAMGFFRLALIIIRISPNNEEKPFPSLLEEGWEERFEDALNSCATVLVIDEVRFAVLDFFNPSQKEYKGLSAIDDVCRKFFGDSATVSRSVSIFPENGSSLSDLLIHADANANRMPAIVENNRAVSSAEVRLSLKSIIKEGESAMDLFHQMLIGSRGKKFKWLTERSFDELWHGLGLLPKVRQKEFLFRLPYNSPLIPELDEAIRKRKMPDDRNRIRHVTE
jgi:hypothetical protein